MTETTREGLIALDKSSNEIFKRLWDGTTTNPEKDVEDYLKTYKEKLEGVINHLKWEKTEFPTSPSYELEQDIMSHSAQLEKVEKTFSSENPLREFVEWTIAGLPRKKGTNEVSDTFKKVEQQLLSYLK